ncbi:YqgE/AlgH family protein [Mesorhizobium sp. BR1-1-16]|uniref:YqgE/AlgH family protein n=1 Tax=Mesorhizobium sp. BR1-1-16 TaxID=2876653 RepID=UPI001CCCE9AD|nr:YqgE/AlgH family protein [Mesorhizobium sp. BR1-1-16]MBZ9934799.1 YqgE/AlgH family protein [Mesorhizobium sp. BR1-1-16]
MSETMSMHATERSYLDGQFLIAMPSMQDDRFARSVIYLCAHSDEGAMGIVVNQAVPQIDFADLLIQLDIIAEGPEIRLPRAASRMIVQRGGPVETGRGFVLHSADYFVEDSTLPIDDNVCLTATLDVLKAIAAGAGPENAMLALGYAGWGAGQLEQEIQANGWLSLEGDIDLIFDTDLDRKYARALALLGIEPAMLSSDAGHA